MARKLETPLKVRFGDVILIWEVAERDGGTQFQCDTDNEAIAIVYRLRSIPKSYER